MNALDHAVDWIRFALVLCALASPRPVQFAFAIAAGTMAMIWTAVSLWERLS